LVSSLFDLLLMDRDKGGIIFMGDLLMFGVVITGEGGKRRALDLTLGSRCLDGLLGLSESLPGPVDSTLSAAVEGHLLVGFVRPQAYSVSVDRLLSPKEYARSSKYGSSSSSPSGRPSGVARSSEYVPLE
jgi:hypothetical protein